MKLKFLLPVTIIVALSLACEQPTETNTAANSSKQTTNASTRKPDLPTTTTPAPTPKDGDYSGKGVVTKLNMELGSVEVNHEEIKDLMPAMTMEFFVSDKTILDGLKVGDKVDFVIRYKDRNETITKIAKTR